MEDSKPTYEQIEEELQEYQKLLWQLSDEYKVNLGAAEAEVQLLKERCKNFEEGETPVDENVIEEKTENEQNPEGFAGLNTSFVNKLGMPACILNEEGQIQHYNNKFKFFVELLSFEFEDVDNISFLLSRDTDHKLLSKYESFKVSDEGHFQSIFKVKSAFQGLINILLRIYHIGETNETLALFIELHKLEIQNLVNTPLKLQELPDNEPVLKEELEKESAIDEEFDNLLIDIAIFAEKYDVFKELVEKLGLKAKNSDLKTETVYQDVVDTFSLVGARKKLLLKLNAQFKDFAQSFNNKFPMLTTNEEKHCMLIKAGLTYKEIAALMNISINGVKIARNRLRKKLNLENETKTNEFIDRF